MQICVQLCQVYSIAVYIYILKEMRYIMKGGVWKNSEDEILKAAIMKYGLNQWSRISSLLQRKSAKQCKQRWYEWLDPSIKKTEWSRAEDEKLLQLARVFPSQWRTIAPFVGRTPTQCFERYEKLLDLAQGKSGQETEDLKRLRPGQIDPNPETKPARLDPIDMDEDEKEMLAEVRVRLANTKGKKAKRKQREKIIEEARRLAQLQKLRQLEMAGVDNIPTAKEIKRMRQKQDIDYNKEIPFKRDVPEFVYGVEENTTAKSTFFASTISLQTLQGKRRDVEEQLQRKIDKKRLKRLKDTDYKAMLAIKSKFQKPVAMPIQLPEPQLNQKDLEDMKRFNITTPLNSVINNNTPFGMTPENKIMLSARVNYSLNHRNMTPIGEDQAEDEDGLDALNYLKKIEMEQRDPNKMRSVDRLVSERVRTPAHNEWEEDQGKVKSLFKNLRKPEHIVEFEIPEEEEEENQEEVHVMDAEEQEKLEEEKAKERELQRELLKSSALKLNLERAKNVPEKLLPSRSQDKIEAMIERQMLNMLYSDVIDYPIDSFTLPEQHSFEYCTAVSLPKRQRVLDLIEAQKGQMAPYEQEKYLQLYEQARKHIKADFKNKVVGAGKKALSAAEQLKQKYAKDISSIQAYKQLEKSNEQAEKKAKKFLGGYEKLISTRVQEINKLEAELEALKMERRTIETMGQHQIRSAATRLEKEERYYKIIYNSI